MLKNFTVQNTILSLAILTATASVVHMLVPSKSNSRQAVANQSEDLALNKQRTQFLPGDERLNIPDREASFDDNNVRRKLTGKFKDGTKVEATFDSFGRILKAVETQPLGQYQVFTFKTRAGQPQIETVQLFTKDNILLTETKLVKETINTTFYGKDGKTRTALQELKKDGTYFITHYRPDGETPLVRQKGKDNVPSAITSYHEDGKSPKVVYKLLDTGEKQMGMDAFDTSEAEIYSATGALEIKVLLGTIPIVHEGSMEPCGECSGDTRKVTRYREDGKTVWVSAYVEILPDDAVNGTGTTIKEFYPDGKTVNKELCQTPHRETPQVDGMPVEDPEAVATVLKKYTSKGKLTKSRFYAPDGAAIFEEEAGKEKVSVEPGEDPFAEYDPEMEEMYNLVDVSGFDELMPYINIRPVSLPPNRLANVLADE